MKCYKRDYYGYELEMFDTVKIKNYKQYLNKDRVFKILCFYFNGRESQIVELGGITNLVVKNEELVKVW